MTSSSPAAVAAERASDPEPVPDPRLTTAVAVGVAFAATLVTAAVFTALHARLSPAEASAVMAVVIAWLGWSTRWDGALVAVALGWLVLDGFAEDSAGALHWHGTADLSRLALLLGCAAIASGSRAAMLAVRRHPAAAWRARRSAARHLGATSVHRQLVPRQRAAGVEDLHHA